MFPLIITLLAATAPLPFLGKDPKLDGVLKDLAPAVDFKMPATAIAQSSALAVKAAFRRDTVWVGVQVTDDKVMATDEVTVTVFFPGSGVTAHGYTYKFGFDGKRASPADAMVPAWAFDAVKAATKTDAKGFGLEIALPPKALPRFQARTHLTFNVCVEYADLDAEEGAATTKLSTCTSGDMVGGPTRVPDELRKVVKVVPPADVEGLEIRGTGVVGFAELHYPTWGYTDGPMSAAALRQLIAGSDSIDPLKVKIPVSDNHMLPDLRPVYTVLTGQDPYAGDKCDAEQEVRLAMYAVKGNVASRVLEWPAITCGLGRALSIQLSAEGSLQIGYSNGSVANFAYSGDHFERSELGAK
ncbi:MAG: hypothetical protein JNK82_25425 [Myxococcaceae bacterium]|nr:hypothetical protein [Myxococcaceae bacterium]